MDTQINGRKSFSFLPLVESLISVYFAIIRYKYSYFLLKIEIFLSAEKRRLFCHWEMYMMVHKDDFSECEVTVKLVNKDRSQFDRKSIYECILGRLWGNYQEPLSL